MAAARERQPGSLHARATDEAMTQVIGTEPASLAGRAELLERLRDCLSFARRTVERADPAHDLWRVDLGQVSGRDKMLMEASLLGLLTRRTGECTAEAEALIRAVRDRYDSAGAVETIMRQPGHVTTLGTILLVLDRFGLTTAEERSALQSALSSPYVDSTERVPFRLLDRYWVLQLAGREPERWDEALRLSAACLPTHPIYMCREDAYAITHAVMYVTDFGARPVPAELEGDDLWLTIDAALAGCLCVDDYDLLAELLLTQLLLRRRLSAYGQIAWSACLATWERLGFLPSPSISVEDFRTAGDDDAREQYAFHSMYHTMLVGGLLCGALLRPDVQPPEARVSLPRRPTGDGDQVRLALDRAAGLVGRVLDVDAELGRAAIAQIEWSASTERLDRLTTVWTDEYAPRGCEEAASRMALDAFLIESARAYDLPQLAEGLRRALQLRHLSATFHAASGFLARQSSARGAIGSGPAAGAPDGSVAVATAALANCLGHVHGAITSGGAAP